MRREQRHVGMPLERPYQRFTDGFARSIRGVDDAGHRMTALQRQRQFPTGDTIERHANAIQQNVLHQPWPLFGQNRGGLAGSNAQPRPAEYRPPAAQEHLASPDR